MVVAKHRIILINEFVSKGLDDSNKKTNAAAASTKKLGASTKKATKSRKDFLTQFTKVRWAIVNIALITAIGVALGKMVISSLETRFEMKKLASVSNESFASIEKAIFRLRKTSISSNKELIESFQELVKTGFTLAESEDILAAAIGASIVGFASEKDTALATAQVLKQFNKEASEASDISFKLAAAANAGKVDIETLGQALKFSGAIADQTGTSFEELASVIAILSSKGLQETQIGRGLRQSFLSIFSASSEAKAAMKVFGIEVVNTGDEMITILGIVEELDNKLGDLSQTQKINILGKIFPSNAISVILELMGDTKDEARALFETINVGAAQLELEALFLQGDELVKAKSFWGEMGLIWQQGVANIVELFEDPIVISPLSVDALREEIKALDEDLELLTESQKERIKNIVPLKGSEILKKSFFGARGKEAEGIFDVGGKKALFDADQIALLTITVKKLREAKFEQIGLNKERDRSTGVTEEAGDILDFYVERLELAKTKQIEYNEEVKRITDLYGDTANAQQLINQLTNDFINTLGFAEEAGSDVVAIFKDLISNQETLADLTSRSTVQTKNYNDANKELDNTLDGLSDSLKTIKNDIDGVNQEISDIQTRRFNIGGISETIIGNLIARQQLEIQKAEFATFNLGTAQEFLRNSTLVTTENIDAQSDALMKLSNVTRNTQGEFDAWRTALSATIKELLLSSQDIDRDVTEVVKRAQIELLGITEFDRTGGDQFSVLETNLEALRLAENIFFGEEKDKLKLSEALREDRIQGQNANAAQAISNLELERSALDELLETEQFWIRQQTSIRSEIVKNREEIEKLVEAERQLQISKLSGGSPTSGTIAGRKDLIDKWNFTHNIRGGVSDSGFSSKATAEAAAIAQFGHQSWFNLADFKFTKKFDDFISRPGEPITSFSPQDTIIGVKQPDLMGGTKIEKVEIIIPGAGKDAHQIAIEVRRELSSLA